MLVSLAFIPGLAGVDDSLSSNDAMSRRKRDIAD